MIKQKQKITVVGSGYVGMSISCMLAKLCEVTIYDIDKYRIDLINNKKSTIKDKDIDDYLKSHDLSIFATTNKVDAYSDADYIVLAVPTNFDEELNFFDTSILDNVIEDIMSINKSSTIIIKSTVPIGYTSRISKKYNTESIIFSPEFLREGTALHDCLYPSRIIIGSKKKQSEKFADILLNSSADKISKIFYMTSTEAESVKLFSNAYLAMRVAFFNELDNFCIDNNLDAKTIIDGVSSDIRIGDAYNNPSFGYGGYCLPKDSKQLLANFNTTPQSLIGAIVESNSLRKKYLIKKICAKKPNVIGIYRLAMKAGSDNYRYSAILDIVTELHEMDYEIIIFEPLIDNDTHNQIKMENDLNAFKDLSDIIIANRIDDQLNDIKHKVFTRDIFGVN